VQQGKTRESESVSMRACVKSGEAKNYTESAFHKTCEKMHKVCVIFVCQQEDDIHFMYL